MQALAGTDKKNSSLRRKKIKLKKCLDRNENEEDLVQQYNFLLSKRIIRQAEIKLKKMNRFYFKHTIFLTYSFNSHVSSARHSTRSALTTCSVPLSAAVQQYFHF